MLLVLTFIAVTAALYFAKPILAPAVFAVILAIVVSPLADRLTALKLPMVAVSAILLLLTSAVVVFLFVLFEPLVSQLIERLPRLKFAAEQWIAEFSGLFQGIETLSQEIEEAVGAETVEPQTVIPSVSDALWLAPNFGAQVFIFVGTLFFFVLTRDQIYDAAGPLKARLYSADASISRYFAAVTLINAGVGVATGLALSILGLEYAILWGLMAGLLNYILYLGPMVMIGGLLIAGMVQFWGAIAFVPPLIFLIINFTEAQFVTPLFVGQQVELNPLVVFLAVVFGLWLWGPIGAIVALPTLLWCSMLLRSPGVSEDGSVIVTA